MLADAWFIARHDLRFMLRQRETLLWVFIMPIVFFYFIGTVTGGLGGGSADRPDPLVVRAPANGGLVVDQIVRRLEEQHYGVVRPATNEEFNAYGRRLTIPAVTSHATLTEAVLAGQQIEVTFEQRSDQLAANLHEFRVSRAVYSVVADLAVLKGQAREASAEGFSAIAAMPRPLTMSVRSAGRRVTPPAGFEQAVPGTMVMFTMIVLLTSGAIMLVVEREYGLLRRLASTPITRGSLVLGKWTARMLLGVVQLGFAMIVGTVGFGVNWGPAVAMVGLVLVAWASLNASLALLLGNIARTQAQATGIGVLASMVLAALGGCWWPIEITPAWMQAIAVALPTGWTMDALHKLVNFGYGPGAAVPHVAAIGLTALVSGAAAAKLFRYQ